MQVWWGSRPSASSGEQSSPSGTSSRPARRAASTFRSRLRPASTSRRPVRWQTWRTCCTRWRCEAKRPTSTRPPASGMSRSSVSATSALRRGLALHLGVGRVAQQAQRLAIGERLEPGDVGGSGVERGLVELEVPGVHHRPLGRPEQEAHRVGDGVGHPEGLDLEDRRGVERLAGEDLPQVGADVHLVEPPGHQRQGEAGAVDRNHPFAEQEGQRADVVLVGVGEQHRAELGCRVPEVAEVRDDRAPLQAARAAERAAPRRRGGARPGTRRPSS